MLKPNIKKVIDDAVSNIEDENVGLAFSGGIDSLSILFSCLEQKKKVMCYSFTLSHHVSTDFSEARKFAKKFGVGFTGIHLPRELNQLKKDLIFLRDMGARKKVDYTCGYPMLYIYKNMKEKVLISGLGADGHYCISKKGMIHFKDNIDAFRADLFKNENYAQKVLNNNIARYYNKQTVIPYLLPEMINEFKGTTWNELNKPRQKYATLMAYKDYFKTIKVRNHTNLQLGDSKIEENLNKLLDSDWNKHKHKSIVGVFNTLNRGEVL